MKNTKICVVGLGYVGLPVLTAFAKKGLPVIGYDINEKRVQELKEGKDRTNEISKELLTKLDLALTSDPSHIKNSNFVIVCVPTPVDENNNPDLEAMISSSKTVGRNLGKGTVVVYESTVYPGVTEEVCVPVLEDFSGLRYLKDFKVGYSPERINPGDKERTISKVKKIVSGCDEETLERVAEVYSVIIEAGIHKAPNIKTAEAAKVIENIQRDLNIALMNELSIIFSKLGIKTKDVLDAASTKWNFQPYHPGLVGGHCFSKNSTVFLINGNHHKVKKMGSYLDALDCKKKVVAKDAELFYPENIKILSFDPSTNKTSFKPVTLASKRKTDFLIKINCAHNYNLEVTDLHPVIIYDGEVKVKFAKDVKVGDKLLLNKILPSHKDEFEIDLLNYLGEEHHLKVRVKIKNKSFSDFRELINAHFKGKKGNYFNHDFLPLSKYLEIEKKLGVNRKDIYLCTGRGPSFKRIPCVFNVNKDFLRLIGYYLSEGCITDDKSLRVRFTFNRKEKEYIEDVKKIIHSLELDCSIYQDKTFQSTTIKVSSLLFGLLLRDVLRCGTNCYTMQIPELFFDLRKDLKEEILKGMFRGDGGVTWYNNAKSYVKNEKEYCHFNNSITVSFFTSSNILFQQVILFLLNQDIIPKLAKREGHLTINGPADVKKVQDWFLGEKNEKISNYLKNIKKNNFYDKAEILKNYITIKVEGIEEIKTDYVYSMEVADTHTLITSNGIIAHNCIGVDPYYLTHRAQELGYDPKVILAGRQINNSMAKYVADLAIDELVDYEKPKVLVMGLTFKENVPDTRNSKAEDVVKELKKHRIDVVACEPLVEGNLFGVENKKFEEVNNVDGVILINKHNAFKEITINDLKGKGVKVLVDVKNLFNENEAKEQGIIYKSL
ncbi:nucleotide sugar dehydrogenase [Candidatus Woesearchaeota archaeon]|nr:nucleotide sugar dehydrogenase [Candidatus Woesearchaeota archaeon]